MESLAEIIKWCNGNQGFCLVLLTFVLAICAIVSCFCAGASCVIAARSAREQSRPHLTIAPVYFDDGIYFGVGIRNCGVSTAYEISFDWKIPPRFPIWIKSKNDAKQGFLVHPMQSLRAGVGYKAFLGPLREIEKDCPELVYSGSVKYKDSTGKKYKEDVRVDFNIFSGGGIMPDSEAFESMRFMKRVAESLSALKGEYVDAARVRRMFSGFRRNVGTGQAQNATSDMKSEERVDGRSKTDDLMEEGSV